MLSRKCIGICSLRVEKMQHSTKALQVFCFLLLYSNANRCGFVESACFSVCISNICFLSTHIEWRVINSKTFTLWCWNYWVRFYSTMVQSSSYIWGVCKIYPFNIYIGSESDREGVVPRASAKPTETEGTSRSHSISSLCWSSPWHSCSLAVLSGLPVSNLMYVLS